MTRRRVAGMVPVVAINLLLVGLVFPPHDGRVWPVFVGILVSNICGYLEGLWEARARA